MAAEISKPDFSFQWASGGAIVAPSDVKIQTGWTAEVPPFQWENFAQNRQDNAILHLFQKGVSEWDAASNYYFTTSGVRSYVQGGDGLIYVAVQDSIGQNPTTDATDTYWKLAFASRDIATNTTTGVVELATTAEMTTGTSTTLVPPVSAIAAQLPFRSFQAIAAAGVTSWEVPAGVIKAYVRVIGGGGGGRNSSVFGGGGGGGGVSEGLITVTPGASITVTVGAGGVGGTYDVTNGLGTAGGTSSFAASTVLSATGGATGGTNGVGGVSGVGSNGTLNYGLGDGGSGGRNATGVFGQAGNGGGAGGYGNTVLASNAGGVALRNGQAPGAGGGGRMDNGGTAGNGAPGAVFIYY